MRLKWKLAVIVVVGIASQALIERHEAEVDEAQFTARVLVARLCGGSAADVAVMDAADALLRRQQARDARRYGSANASTRPDEARAASIAADELEWSLCAEVR